MYIHTNIYIYLHTYIHPYVHTYIHTYIQAECPPAPKEILRIL